jgi:hypothetical protein
MELGKDVDTSVVEYIMQMQKPNQCASIVYTVRYTCIIAYVSHCIMNIHVFI